MKRIAWGISGAGHWLRQCMEIIAAHDNIDVFLSRAAEEVIRMYRPRQLLERPGCAVLRDTMASSPVVSRFSKDVYKVLVIAPATSNSVAKFVHGISDSLISNIFAQAGKSRVPIVVLPTDIAPEMDSETPRGTLVKVYPRPIDLENTARLRQFPGVTVVESIEELQVCLSTYL